MKPAEVQCPDCGAAIGKPCVTDGGRELRRPHRGRRRRSGDEGLLYLTSTGTHIDTERADDVDLDR